MAREGYDALTPLLRILDNIRADMQNEIRIMQHTKNIDQWRVAKSEYDHLLRKYNRVRERVFRDFGRQEGYARRRKIKRK